MGYFITTQDIDRLNLQLADVLGTVRGARWTVPRGVHRADGRAQPGCEPQYSSMRVERARTSRANAAPRRRGLRCIAARRSCREFTGQIPVAGSCDLDQVQP